MTGRPTVAIVSPYRIEYGPSEVLGHVVRALAAAQIMPLCIVPEEARRSPDLERSEARVIVLDGLATVPRTWNAARLGVFLNRHMQVADELRAIAADERVAAVYSISEATFAGGIAARRLGIPSIVHVIGMSIQSPRLGGHVYVNLLNRLTDQFIACSSAVAEMLSGFGTPDDKITVVHNGISVEEIAATEEAPTPITGSHPRIGMIAAYDPRKGHELFVDAAAIIARRFPSARFFLIGGVLGNQAQSPAFEHRIERLIAARGLEAKVERPGYIPPPEIYTWIRGLDLVIVPSKTEAFAHALLEAMLCRVPVVATAIEGNLDAFVDGHSGLYAAPTPTSVAQCAISLLEDPARSAAIAEAGHRRARLLFDLEVTLPALGAAIWRSINRPRNGGVANEAP
jgi:glycosyltransferase involved in cell wall biosynthesis